MAIPFLFPIAGLVVSGTGVGMIVTYIRAGHDKRSRLDQWMTDAAKAAVRAYLLLRYKFNLHDFSAEEEQEYWNQFGSHVEEFLLLAEPIAMRLYCKQFVELTAKEQAEVARHVRLEDDEPPPET